MQVLLIMVLETLIGGTGGLLLIYSNVFCNNGIVSSNGTVGYGAGNYKRAGGSSGGGSINIFFKNLENKGTMSATGNFKLYGGAGGEGSITIGNISTGTFAKDE